MLELPLEIQSILNFDEKILMIVNGSPRVYVTNHRIILRKTGSLGLRKSIIDYSYDDIANIRVDKGLARSNVELKVRSGGPDVKVTGIPKKEAYELHKVIRGNIRRAPTTILMSPSPPSRENSAKTTIRCPVCFETMSQNFSVCPFCGTSIKPKCPQCERAVSPEYQVCPFCGSELAQPDIID